MSRADRILGWVERWGNRLPDPAILFVIVLVATWVLSWLLAGHAFVIPARDGPQTREVLDQLSGRALMEFLADMVTTFTSFKPLGVVLVALLGVGVAERSGWINACLKGMLRFTPPRLLTPMLMLVAVLSHTTADAGFVLVIPLGGVIFLAAGRHPLAGIAACFAGVSGGFSASFIPAPLDPLLQGITQEAARIIDPLREVNPLCNWLFTAVAAVPIILIGWWLTDRVIEPRLRKVAIDADPADLPKMEPMSAPERRGLLAGCATMAAGLVALYFVWEPEMMQAIVPLIFLLFLAPGVVHGYASGTFRSHRDVVAGMTHSMATMSHYMVMAFFASLFIYSFNKSQLGALLAVEGAGVIRTMGLPAPVMLVGVILLAAGVDLVIGSASAKWALLAPILVPMLMQLGLSPELIQASYRVGDSTTNIITPLMPYFPLVVAYCQRYVKTTGIGTLTALMLPYSLIYLAVWTALLLGFWGLGIPLGIQGVHTYP